MLVPPLILFYVHTSIYSLSMSVINSSGNINRFGSFKVFCTLSLSVFYIFFSYFFIFHSLISRRKHTEKSTILKYLLPPYTAENMLHLRTENQNSFLHFDYKIPQSSRRPIAIVNVAQIRWQERS